MRVRNFGQIFTVSLNNQGTRVRYVRALLTSVEPNAHAGAPAFF